MNLHPHRVLLPRAVRSPVALVAVAGMAAAVHGQFVFNPVCNTNWFGTCGAGNCPGGGFQTINNWGQSNCAGGSIAGPGAGNTASLPAGVCNANGNVGIAGLTTNPATNLNIQFDFSVPSHTLNCPWTVTAGNNTVSGAYTIGAGGSWTWQIGWNTNLSNFTIANGGLLDLQNRTLNNAVGSAINNSATVRKTTGADVQLSSIPFNHNAGLVSIDGGRLFFNTCPVTSTAVANWAVAAGAQMYFRSSSSIAGTFTGVNNGFFRLENQSVAADTTLNITGNPVDINGNLSAGAFTLTNNGLLQNSNGNNTLTGNITNTGTFTHETGWNTQLDAGTLTNTATGTLNTNNRTFSTGGGGAIINHGTWLKNTGSDVQISGLPITNNNLCRVNDGRLFFNSCSITAAPASSWPVVAGQMYLRTSTLRGPFTGNNAGLWRLENCTFDDNSTLAISGTPADINANITVSPGKTLTNNGLLQNVNGNNTLTGNITNTGTFTHETGWGTQLDACTLTNTATGTLNTNNRTFSTGGGGAIINHGTWLKNAGSDVHISGLPITNNNLCRVNAGNLFFNSCSITAAPTSSWPVVAGQMYLRNSTLRGSFTGNNAGLWRLENCTFDDNSTLAISGTPADINGNMTVSPGKTLTNNGLLQNVNGNNTLTGNITNTGTFTHETGWNTQLDGSTLTNTATGTLNTNNRTFNTGGGGAIVNHGTWKKNNGSDVSISNIAVTNTNLINALGGSLRLNAVSSLNNTGTIRSGANIQLPDTFNATSGRYDGTGQFQVNAVFTNSGATLSPGNGPNTVGSLNMTGDYTHTATGHLVIDVSGPNQADCDKFNLIGGFPRGVATIGGTTVELNRVGGYIPLPGTRWTFMTYRTRVGEFGAVAVLNPVAGRSYRVLYGPNFAEIFVQSSCGLADIGQQGGIAGPDGFLDNNDFIVFINGYFNADPVADLGVQGGIPGSDGNFDNNDFVVYINAFFAGCAS